MIINLEKHLFLFLYMYLSVQDVNSNCFPSMPSSFTVCLGRIFRACCSLGKRSSYHACSDLAFVFRMKALLRLSYNYILIFEWILQLHLVTEL